ncbi:MAG: NAD-dependent succinate-semialdehyde dehydrogenase [Acidobacteria bacterium]|nr:NAD-dependent succinate-semialdehyde dehydrogenase [Acidobacteriota bacterium]
MQGINPATGQVLATYDEHTAEQVERKLASAWSAWPGWREVEFAFRSQVLRRAAALLEERRARYAALMAQEMGKPVAAGSGEAEKCAWVCRYYADHAAELLAPERIETGARDSHVRFDPLGPVLAVMPWNFPFWQVFRFAAPALMAGNVGLLKHSSNVPGCALAIEELFRDAGVPEGCFQALLVSGRTAEELIDDPRIRAATLTGSDPAGRAVAARAGRNLKKTVLELGGSDPFVVLADADVEAAARTAASARLVNSGQSCIAAKRFIVHREVAEAFTAKFVGHMRAAKVGDPLQPDTQVGPLAREDLLEALHDQVRRTIAAGATCLCGGARLPQPGFYYAPTVLAGVRPGMPAAEEETFGPVAAVMTAASDDEAIALANATPFGLGASLWTRDLARAAELARRTEAGCVFVNGMVKSDPRVPFGGVKLSGYGRELGREGIREFVNIKTVWIE